MVRGMLRKVMWVGRATSTVVGLAVILALILGVATTAMGAAQAPAFKLGQINASNAVSTLVGAVSGSNLKIENTGTDANATALELKVPQGKAPLKVNADAGTATNLKAADSDKLGGKQASEFASSTHAHSGADITSGTVAEARIDDAVARDGEIVPTVKANDGSGSGLDADTIDGKDSGTFAPKSGFRYGRPITYNGGLPREGTYVSQGGNLLISVAGSGYRSSSNARMGGYIGIHVSVDGDSYGVAPTLTNERDSHKAFVPRQLWLPDLPAGSHTIRLDAEYNSNCNTNNETPYMVCTTTDDSDRFEVSVIEFPR